MKNTESKISQKKNIIKAIRIIFWSLAALLLLMTLWFFVPVTEDFDFSEGDQKPVRCVLITDLHSCFYGKDQKNIIKMVEKQEPDIVFFGGDIFDDRLSDDNAVILLEALSKEYKCFYVTGNHEYWSERCDEMKDTVRKLGVTVLAGDCESITVNGRTIDVCGVDDPTRLYERQFVEQLDNAYAKTDEDHIKILLTHRPERTDLYEKYDFDYILSGHAHAGQIRIPFINRGILTPNQGFFPKYTGGVYELENGSVMILSRGLARESTPLPRFFNHPEIIVFEI